MHINVIVISITGLHSYNKINGLYKKSLKLEVYSLIISLNRTFYTRVATWKSKEGW